MVRELHSGLSAARAGAAAGGTAGRAAAVDAAPLLAQPLVVLFENLARLNALQATLRARGCRLRELTTIVRC